MASDKQNEHELLSGLKEGSREYFALIYDKYWLLLYHIAYNKVHSAEAAEEIVQDIFVSLWEKRTILLINDLRHYLTASLRNRCIDYIRTSIVKDKYWDYYKAFIPQVQEGTEEFVVFNELQERVDKVLQQLPEKSRKVFHLSRIEGLSVAEIARACKLSEKAIEYHITKSLKALKLHLKDYILLASLVLIQ